jgi:protoporphyrinogen/coproporphyrinogen III oxidase
MKKRIAVIGGGISGLAAAQALAVRAPAVETLLFEASNRLGGVLNTTRRDGFLVEAAADNFLVAPAAAVDLCRDVGLADSLIGVNQARRRAFVVHCGRLQPIPMGFQIMAPSRLLPLITSPVLSVRGKLRAGLEYLIPAAQQEADESLAAFVRRRFGHEVFDRLVQPLVGGIYTSDAELLSLEATMPRFRQMERRHGSLIRAAMRERRRQRREISAATLSGLFATPREGMSSLVNAIAKRLPPRTVHVGSPVNKILPVSNHQWRLSIGGQVPRSIEVDGVIVATPAHQAARALANVDPLLGSTLAQLQYSSCAVISLGYRRDQIKHPLDGLGFVVPLVENRTILACSFSSIKYQGRAPSGSVLLRVFVGGACQSGLLRLSNNELVQLGKREVTDLLAITGEPVLQELTRQHQAMPQYHVGHRQWVATLYSRLSRFKALALAGSSYEGVGIPACVQSGQAAADLIMARLDARVQSTKTIPIQAETCA